MHTVEIRKICYNCGYKVLKSVDGSPMATDVCGLSKVECSKIAGCDPSVRIPRKREIRKKKADPFADKFREPEPDAYDDQDGQETDNPPRLW